MNASPRAQLIPPTFATRCFSAASRLLSAGLTLALVAFLPQAAASIPVTEANGYLNVAAFNAAIAPQGSETDVTRSQRTFWINEALKYAYANNVALYFPAGTYEVNDTLKAYTAFVNPSGSGFAVPRNAIAVIGSTLGSRPVIKLVPVPGDTSFDAGKRKPVLAFKNFDVLPAPDEEDDDPASGYFQMLRGIDIDCGGKAGAVGLYFAQAQNSSVENVRINALGAFAGIRGLPSRTWGAVNIEVEGGDFGLDNLGVASAGAGTVVAGAVFRNQKIAAVRHSDFVPMVIVGFEIQTPADSSQSALRIQPSAQANAASLALIDGRITLGAEPAVAAIDNNAGQSIYVRNVYVTGGDKLVKSLGEATVNNPAGPWKRIDEYSFCDQSGPDNAGGKITQVLVEGSVSRTPPAATLTGNAGDPPVDIVSRHRWVALPSVDDPDAVDVTAPPAPLAPVVPAVDENDPAVVDSAALQAIIDAHRKVFLPKGIYRLTAPGITLRPDTILYGAARNLTRVEVDPTWKPTQETPVIRTDDDAAATTYLGDLTIGVKVRPGATFAELADITHDFFTALDWQAGRDSMVHIGQPYRVPDGNNPSATQDHSLLKIHGNGGGRWYFAGAIKTGTSQNPAYRILEVSGTSEPLWFYGLNPEHALGAATYCEFTDASNIRIYTVKSEFSNALSSLRGDSVLLRFANVNNVAQFGHGAIRNAVLDHGCIEFLDSDNVLVALINPQNNVHNVGLGPNHHTLRQTDGASTIGIAYPNCVALYKKGVLDDAAMRHHAPSYGPEFVFYSIEDEDGWLRESTETSGVGGTVVANANGPQALRIGDSPDRRQYKSIVSFDTSSLPPAGDAVIHAATLELVRGTASGNPGALGALRADIATGSFGASTLAQGDFEAAATATDVIPIFSIPAADGDVAIGVLNPAGRDAINRDGRTQLRVYFASDDNNDNAADLLGCYCGKDPVLSNRPVLRVQYRQP